MTSLSYHTLVQCVGSSAPTLRIRRTFDPSPQGPQEPLSQRPCSLGPSHPLHTPEPTQPLPPAHTPADPWLESVTPIKPRDHRLTGSTTQTPLHTYRLRGSHTAHTPPPPVITCGVSAMPTSQNRIEKLCGVPAQPKFPNPTCDNFEIPVLNWVSKLGPGMAA